MYEDVLDVLEDFERRCDDEGISAEAVADPEDEPDEPDDVDDDEDEPDEEAEPERERGIVAGARRQRQRFDLALNVMARGPSLLGPCASCSLLLRAPWSNFWTVRGAEVHVTFSAPLSQRPCDASRAFAALHRRVRGRQFRLRAKIGS